MIDRYDFATLYNVSRCIYFFFLPSFFLLPIANVIRVERDLRYDFFFVILTLSQMREMNFCYYGYLYFLEHWRGNVDRSTFSWKLDFTPIFFFFFVINWKTNWRTLKSNLCYNFFDFNTVENKRNEFILWIDCKLLWTWLKKWELNITLYCTYSNDFSIFDILYIFCIYFIYFIIYIVFLLVNIFVHRVELQRIVHYEFSLTFDTFLCLFFYS